jgi:hypothetical protein
MFFFSAASFFSFFMLLPQVLGLFGNPKIVAAQVDLPQLFFHGVPQLFFWLKTFLRKLNLFTSANIVLWAISGKSKSNASIWTSRDVRLSY